jgi:hypothetical protein
MKVYIFRENFDQHLQPITEAKISIEQDDVTGLDVVWWAIEFNSIEELTKLFNIYPKAKFQFEHINDGKWLALYLSGNMERADLEE